MTPRPTRTPGATRPTIDGEAWHLARDAREDIAAAGLTERAVLAVVARPASYMASRRVAGAMIATRGGVWVMHSPSTRTVLGVRRG